MPAYVQRLSNEPVFHGRRFATLDMRAIEPEVPKPDASGSQPVAPSAMPARYVEFALRSANAGNSTLKDAGAAVGGKQ